MKSSNDSIGLDPRLGMHSHEQVLTHYSLLVDAVQAGTIEAGPFELCMKVLKEARATLGEAHEQGVATAPGGEARNLRAVTGGKATSTPFRD